MKTLVLTMMVVFIGTSGAFAQQQRAAKPKPVSAQTNKACPKGYDGCVRGGMKMGYTSVEAGRYCTRRCAGL